MTTNVVNNIADFAELWFPLYIDLLLDLPVVDPDYELHRFVDQSRRHFAHNPRALEFINEFQENYMPHGALYYYSYEGLVYHLVNRVLRRQAIEGILDFRFFLRDIRDQLQSAHKEFLDEQTKVGMLKTFFRGQRMSHDEIKELERKHIDGTLITTNSYFSTSESSEIARIFAGQPTDDIVSVLFEITAKIKDPKIQQRKPFAKISTYSTFGEAEREVLFSIGSFFKIDKIYEESPSFWIVKITFVDENADEKQKVIEDYRTLRTCSSEAKLIKIGHLLANHPQQGISQAKTFYQLMMTSKFSETFIATCTAGLGWLALKEKDGKLAIELQLKALSLYEHLPKSDSENLTHLYITSYNCIGASFRLMKRYRRAFNYYKKAEELLLKVPIDKYAMYDGYRNITSINIASIHQLMGEIDLAWESYKNILAYEMNSSTRFHGHTYLTIAQAGLYEAKIANDVDEYERCSQRWKAFLDKSLTNMSSNYRRSIISGVLLIGFEYADNEQRRTMAIDYFQKLINISRRYVKVNPDDYHIVLQCLNQLARLYTKKRNYDSSINHALEALNMCQENELANIKECYESMVLNYEQLLDQTDDLTPDYISKMIVENPLLNLTTKTIETTPAVILTFKRSEFAFGQYSTKTMDPKFLKEPDLLRRLAYCRLKVAALAQAQGYKDANQAKLNDDDLLEKKAQKDIQIARILLKKVAESFKDDPQVQQICANNMSYLNEDFNSIIKTYQEDLNVQQKNSLCVGEDAFCYIAHLYARKKEVEEENRWYNAAIQYFESHGHICEHTVICFRRLVHFHEKHENDIAAIDILRRLADYLLQHSPRSFLRTSIEPIVMEIVQYFYEKQDRKQIILILQDFIDLILTEPADDMCRIDEQFRKLISKCKDDPHIVNQAYGTYLEILLRYKPLSLNSYVRAVEPAFRQAIEVYHTYKNHCKSIETYQQFIELLVSSTTNHHSTEAAFKRLALDFETLKLYDIALDMYLYLGKFILNYQKKDDLVLASFVIVRCKFLKLLGAVFNENTQPMFIQLMIFYHNNAEPQFIFSEYFQSRHANVDRRSCSGIYIDLLEFCFQYRSELYENHMKTNVVTLENRPAELIAFVTMNRVNYKALILHIFETFKNRSEENSSFKQLSSNYETAALEWLSSIENNRTVYWSQLLHRLLELQSIDDEYLAMSYTKMDDMNAAASLFSTDIYGNPALRFNSNACRRYLRYVYPQASSEERINLELRYHKHFFVECDSFADQMSYEVLPNE
jgi:hypothetical protein